MATVKARLASGNPHKLEELRAALTGWELELLETERDELADVAGAPIVDAVELGE